MNVPSHSTQSHFYQLVSQLIFQLIVLSVKCQNIGTAQGNILKLLILPDQQYKMWINSVCYYRKQRKAPNPHIWEPGTSKCFAVFFFVLITQTTIRFKTKNCWLIWYNCLMQPKYRMNLTLTLAFQFSYLLMLKREGAAKLFLHNFWSFATANFQPFLFFINTIFFYTSKKEAEVDSRSVYGI